MVKVNRILKIPLVAVMLYVSVVGVKWFRRVHDRVRPVSAAVPNVPIYDIPIIDPVFGIDHWLGGDGKRQNVPWTNFHNSVSGKVSLFKWKSANKTYYEVRGPINSDYGKSGAGYPVCQIFLPCAAYGFGYDQWRISLRGKDATVVSRRGQSSRLLPKNRMKIRIKDSYITILFWVGSAETVGNIVFNYKEDDYVAYVATELPGSKGHENMLTWIMP